MGYFEWSAKHEQFKRDGLVILDGLFSNEEMNAHNRLVEEIRKSINDKKDAHGWGDRIGMLHQKEHALMSLASNPALLSFLTLALADDPMLFGSLNFEKGSEQRIHVDAIFFWPEPFYSMAGVWIALEDVGENNGPLVYLPGSHQWDMIRSEDIVSDRPELSSARERARDGLMSPEEKGELVASLGNAWTEKYMMLVEKNQVAPLSINVKKGDVVVWHSLLGHGGGTIKDRNCSRKSVVYHYLGERADLFSFENYMLLNKEEFAKTRAEKANVKNYGNLKYMHHPYFVTYEEGQQVVHKL